MTSARAESDPADLIVREALVAAVEVARTELASAETSPEVPRPMRRIAGFHNLSKAALAQVRKVLDEDPRFRERVAAAVGSGQVDEASWLFLHRPTDWSERLARIAASEPVRKASELGGSDGAAQRRLRAAEAARDRSERELESLRDAVAESVAALQHERASRSRAEAQLEELRAELDVARQSSDRAAARIREAEGKHAEEAHRVEQVRAARDLMRAERDRLRAELDELRREHADLPAAQEERSEGSGVPGAAGLDPAVAEAVDAAATAAAQLAANLAETARLLRPPERKAGSTEVRPPSASPPGRRARERRRSPVPLPPGVFDDSPDAATHLVKVAGLVLFIDGYNASMARWPELPLDEQRRRLVDAATELHARCGVTVNVVFDGSQQESRAVATAARGVSVTFTEQGREADDAIIDSVWALPDTPVAVASDDRRVRAGVAAAGANILTLQQLFGVLRREG